jgi:hypothetical protein
VEKYLRHYAEPETAALDGLPLQPCWENVVVIPACNEAPEFLRPPPPCGGRSLMILVINESPAASREVSLRNLELAEEVRTRFSPLWHSAPEWGLSLWQDPSSERDLLLVDRFSKGRQIPARGGVGFARKLGSDLALSLIQRQRVRSHWIHCTDADVKLPATYFSCCNVLPGTGSRYAVLVYPFSHCESHDRADAGEVFLATRLYELSLRYYVAGMKFARSPYAFHTIGSTMAVRALHYARVRGFPKREAGEDFYLLNKLAKVGSVLELVQGPGIDAIEIASRRSDRVPFGTGAAVNKITAMEDPFAGFRFYDPTVFGLLKLWLQSWPNIWQTGSASLDIDVLSAQAEDQQPIHLRQALLDCLQTLKTEQALAHAFKQSSDLDQFSRQLHTWFDAFRTLKLVHALRDRALPSVSYAGLLDDPLYQQLLTTDPELLDFHEHLLKNSAKESLYGNARVPSAPPITKCVKDIPNA